MIEIALRCAYSCFPQSLSTDAHCQADKGDRGEVLEPWKEMMLHKKLKPARAGSYAVRQTVLEYKRIYRSRRRIRPGYDQELRIMKCRKDGQVDSKNDP